MATFHVTVIREDSTTQEFNISAVDLEDAEEYVCKHIPDDYWSSFCIEPIRNAIPMPGIWR